MGPECACGCGEHLPEGSRRKWKNGHRPPEDMDMPDLSGIADVTEPDPEPLAPDGDTPAEPLIRITKAVTKDIEGKLGWMLGMTGTVWAAADPLCAGQLLEHADTIAAKLTPVICQSQTAVRWFRKSSGAVLYVDLLIACMPVLSAVYAHHLARQPSPNGMPAEPHLPPQPFTPAPAP